jgi:hypothetical protein
MRFGKKKSGSDMVQTVIQRVESNGFDARIIFPSLKI